MGPMNVDPQQTQGRSAFRTDRVLGDFGAEARADEFRSVLEERPDLLAELDQDVAARLQAYPVVVAMELTGGYQVGLSPEATIVLNHAVNDLLDLFSAVHDCAGRAAARAARALFEHLVNLIDVISDVTYRERYIAHSHVTAALIARHAAGMDLLKGKQRRRERERLRRMEARSQRPLAEAIATYGGSFRRQWHPLSLRDRAEKHGLGRGYEAYQILSGVLHGNSGSLLGTRRETQAGSIHRSGPDLELTGLALVEGLETIREFAVRMGHAASSFDSSLVVEATDDVLKDWPVVLDHLRRLDRKLWPSTPPPTPVAVLAIYPSGRRWYIHDRRTDELFLAEAPEEGLTPEMEADVSQLVKLHPPRSGERPTTIAMLGVTLRRRPRVRPVHAAAILVPPELGG